MRNFSKIFPPKFPKIPSISDKFLDFGSGGHLVWSNDNGYAVASGSEIKIFDSSFNQIEEINLDFPVESLYGGKLLGINAGDFIVFYTWEGTMIQKVDITPKDVIWNPKNNLLTITGKEGFFLLSYQENVSYSFSKN